MQMRRKFRKRSSKEAIAWIVGRAVSGERASSNCGSGWKRRLQWITPSAATRMCTRYRRSGKAVAAGKEVAKLPTTKFLTRCLGQIEIESLEAVCVRNVGYTSSRGKITAEARTKTTRLGLSQSVGDAIS